MSNNSAPHIIPVSTAGGASDGKQLVYSQATAPIAPTTPNTAIWYDTTESVWKQYNPATSTWDPIGVPALGSVPSTFAGNMITVSGSAYVWNGTSYIPASMGVDGNLTMDTQTGNAPVSPTTPVAPPSTPDTGDAHREEFDDKIIWWEYDGTNWILKDVEIKATNEEGVIYMNAEKGTLTTGEFYPNYGENAFPNLESRVRLPEITGKTTLTILRFAVQLRNTSGRTTSFEVRLVDNAGIAIAGSTVTLVSGTDYGIVTLPAATNITLGDDFGIEVVNASDVSANIGAEFFIYNTIA